MPPNLKKRLEFCVCIIMLADAGWWRLGRGGGGVLLCICDIETSIFCEYNSPKGYIIH
jgi:hypothetical protein